MKQPTLWTGDWPFAGVTYSYEKDCKRLTGQLHKVREALSDGKWWTLSRLQSVVGGSESGISARLRDLRKDFCGNQTIERRRVEGSSGLWEYKLVQS